MKRYLVFFVSCFVFVNFVYAGSEKSKAISNKDTGTLTIYNENDEILLRRTGLTKQQVKKIEVYLANYGLKQVDENQEPFTYL